MIGIHANHLDNFNKIPNEIQQKIKVKSTFLSENFFISETKTHNLHHIRNIMSEDEMIETNKETHSVHERKTMLLKLDEEEKPNESGTSIYNITSNNNNESQIEHQQIGMKNYHHPYQDVLF